MQRRGLRPGPARMADPLRTGSEPAAARNVIRLGKRAPQEDIMRRIITGGTLLAMALALGLTVPANAQAPKTERFCKQLGDGSLACEYATMEQCRGSAGARVTCVPNPASR
jgi:hypothetical protein